MSAPANPSDSLFDDDPEPPPLARAGAASTVAPAWLDEELFRLGRQLPPSVHLGTSSWSFPGWQGIVYSLQHTEAQLARHGLAAYSQHPILRAVGIDRTFYQPLTVADYTRYTAQVPEHFRFLVKAPALVSDAVTRRERGAPADDNPHFLDPVAAREHFVLPALEGLGARAGPLVFQLPPLPREWTQGEAAAATIERIGTMLAGLPRSLNGVEPIYAVELRNPELLTPRFVRTLREHGTRLCIAIHARMPPAARQSAALRAMDVSEDEGDDWRMKGPLVVRWSLASGFRYEDAKNRYAPFDRLIDPDIPTRGTLAHLIHVALRSGQPSFVIVNNKAEGSAPLSAIELARAVVR
jgi:uncharacterized protein YecE (DUF72 family)